MEGNYLIDTIKSLQERVSALERARQPQFISWVNVPYNSVSLNGSTGTITFVDRDPRNFLGVGSKIRLSQSSYQPTSFKYAYVASRTSNSITIIGDSLSGNNLYYLDYCSSGFAVGFPAYFSYAPTLTFTRLTGTTLTMSSSGTVSATFCMLENTVHVIISRSSVSITGNAGDAGELKETLPLSISSGVSVYKVLHGDYLAEHYEGFPILHPYASYTCPLVGNTLQIIPNDSYETNYITKGTYSWYCDIWYDTGG